MPRPPLTALALLLVCAAVLAAGCAAAPPAAPAAAEPSATPAPAPSRAPAEPSATPAGPTPTVDRWAELFARTPYPYTTPLPAPEDTPLEGMYAKVEQIEGTPTPCRRCPDYKVEGGVWRLSLDNGIFRVYHTVTGWRSLGSYTVQGDQLLLFNDPTCLDVVGSYRWSLAGGALVLTEIEDSCAIRLRARNLTSIPWDACQPPGHEAGVTDHWKKPAGCG